MHKLDNRGSAFGSWLENRIFSPPQHPDQLDDQFGFLFTNQGFKRPEREADHSPPYTMAFNLKPISSPRHSLMP